MFVFSSTLSLTQCYLKDRFSAKEILRRKLSQDMGPMLRRSPRGVKEQWKGAPASGSGLSVGFAPLELTVTFRLFY